MNEAENRNLSNTSDDRFPREFRIDPQLRRSCLYLVFGGWLVIGTMVFVRAALGNPPDSGIWPGLILFGLGPILLWSYVVTYRLRLDEWGLSRRRLWWWTLWPWESFAAGEVSFFVRKAILARSKSPVWDRWMVFGFFSKSENEFLREALRHVIPPEKWHEGERLELPTEQVQEAIVGLVLTRKLRVDHHGCAVLWQKEQLIPWKNIILFRIARSQQKDMNVFQIEIQIRDRSPITGHLNSVTLNGKSVGSIARSEDSWSQRLKEIVPQRCWRFFRADGELYSIEEGEFRLKQLKEKLQLMRWFDIAGWSFLPMTALMFGPKAVAAWNIPFLPVGWKLLLTVISVFMIFKPTILICALTRYLRPRFQQDLDETNRKIAAFAEQFREQGASPENPCHFQRFEAFTGHSAPKVFALERDAGLFYR